MNNFKLFIHHKIKWLKHNQKSITAWLAVGFSMVFISTFILYLFVDILKIKLAIATFLTAEIALILRFLINHKYIFKTTRSSYWLFLQFHIASASAFLIWWSATNILAFFNVYYIYASLLAVGFSTGFNFLSNFLWIWKDETKLH